MSVLDKMALLRELFAMLTPAEQTIIRNAILRSLSARDKVAQA